MPVPVTTGTSILAAEYNTVRTPVTTIYAAGAANTQWYQTAFSVSVVADVDSITEVQLFNLFIDLQSLYVHMYGSLSPDAVPPNQGQKIGADESLAYDQATGAETAVTDSALMSLNDYNQIKIDIDNFTPAHLAYPPGNFAPGSTLSSQRTTNWGNTSTTDDIYAVIEVEFQNGADQENAWLNAGGQFTFNADLASGSGAKSTDWANLLSAMGTVYVDKFATSATSGTSFTNSGIQDLTSTYKTLWQKDGSGGYSDNNYRLEGRRVSAQVYRFRVRFYDGDTGTGDLGGPGTGTPIDEAVNGTLTSRFTPLAPQSGFIWDGSLYTACAVSLPNYNVVYALSNNPSTPPT